MNFQCVIDTSAFIWNRQQFDQTPNRYYQLADELMTFFDCLEAEKPKILMRGALRDEMVNGFPYDAVQGIPNFHELSMAIYGFLGGYADGVIEFSETELEGIITTPNIVYGFYNPNVKKETIYLISYIHQDATASIYFTFQPIWTGTASLNTSHSNTDKAHQTIISSAAELKKFFDQFKLVFEHNKKHDKLLGWRVFEGKEIAPLSCDNGQTTNPYAQQLLLTAIPSTTISGLFNWDDVNGTYVRFLEHSTNRYHAFDERTQNVPRDIVDHFHK